MPPAGTVAVLCCCTRVFQLVASPGSDLSEELVVGVEPAGDFRVVPRCPPGLAASLFVSDHGSPDVVGKASFQTLSRFARSVSSARLVL